MRSAGSSRKTHLVVLHYRLISALSVDLLGRVRFDNEPHPFVDLN